MDQLSQDHKLLRCRIHFCFAQKRDLTSAPCAAVPSRLAKADHFAVRAFIWPQSPPNRSISSSLIDLALSLVPLRGDWQLLRQLFNLTFPYIPPLLQIYYICFWFCVFSPKENKSFWVFLNIILKSCVKIPKWVLILYFYKKKNTTLDDGKTNRHYSTTLKTTTMMLKAAKPV